MAHLPRLHLGHSSDDPAEMLRHLNLAISAYAGRNPKKAATSLHDAETAAKKPASTVKPPKSEKL